MKKRIPNSYSAFPSSVNMRYGKRMSNGGAMNQLTEFNEGGRHEENGLGGIPQGMNEQGQMNLVEEGETKFNAENYIFSDTLKVDKELAKAFNLNPKMVGKTFADASKLAGRKKSRREGDKIEEAANDADLMNLMEAQEAFKQKEIEERLAEIDALDPNALPAMMGQGQPQGNPAMGGQMQEASMMDQEAMMAEQGGPSPEEMAMMQNQMMGQQEGMMRSGGKIPKSVLLSRAKSHMSDAAAQEYVKNYEKGGKFDDDDDLDKILGDDDLNSDLINKTNLTGLSFEDTPTYSTGFPNSLFNFRNSPFELGTVEPTNSRAKWLRDPRNPSYSQMLFLDEPEKNIDISRYNTSSKDDVIQIDFKDPNYRKQVYDEITNNKATVETPANFNIGYNSYGRSPRKSLIKSDFKKNIDEGINDETNRELYGENYGRGGYMSRSYAPGGFMGMNMANANMMNTGDPVGCLCADGSTNTACCVQGYEEGSQRGITGRDYQGMFRGRNLPFRHKRALKKADVNLAQGEKVFEEGLSGSGGLRSTAPANWANLDLSGYTKEQQDKILSSELLRKDPAAFAELNPFLSKQDLKQAGSVKAALEWTPPAQEAGFDITPFSPDDGSTRGGDGSGTLKGPRTGTRRPYNPQPKFTKWGWIASRLNPRMEPLQTKFSNPQLRWTEGNQKMRRGGGKLCYGCGGKMHAYGGRMSVPGIQHKYGAGMQTAGTILDTAADFAKYIPVVGQIVAPIAEAGANVLQGAGEAKATDTAYSWKDAAFDAGAGAAGTFVPGAEQAIQAAGDIATKKEKTEEMEKKQAILSDPTHPDHEEVKAAMEARATDKSLQDAQTFQNVWNKTAGMASQFINPGEAADTAATVTEAAPDAITDTVTDTTGLVGEGMGYGNWADIDMEAPELPYGTGGRMGSNYLKNGGGLWANIRAKKERMGKNYRPAQPGDKDYPTEKAIKAAQQQMGGSLTNPMNIEPLPLMPANQFGSPAQATLPFNYAYNMQPTSIADFFQGENEINVDVDQEDVNRDFKFKETPMQAAAKALPIAANLYSGLFSKYDPKYEPEFVATEAPKLDYTESLNAIRRSTAGLRKDLRKFGRNPGNLQVAAQKGAQLEAQAIQQVDTINAKLQFEAEKLNKAEKQKLERMKKQLMLTFDEAKRKSLQAASEQTKQMVEANQANELAAYYATMAGEGIGSVEYKTLADQFAEMLKNRNKNKKKK